MSLDIYLYDNVTRKKLCVCQCCDNEHEVEYKECLFHLNITHNLGEMASACGVYDIMWRLDENEIRYASEMIDILENGLNLLSSDPEKFKKLNPSNGWGSYENLIFEVSRYLEACRQNPTAEIEVNR